MWSANHSTCYHYNMYENLNKLGRCSLFNPKNKIKIIILFFHFINLPLFAQSIIPLDYLYTIGTSGDSLGQFYNPQAITVGPSGNLYVVDTGNNRIQTLDLEGNFIKYVGGIGQGQEQFDSPLDINFQDGLNVFVTDYNNHRVYRLDRQLNAISIISGEVTYETIENFFFPKSITVSRQGDIFLVEGENNSVIKFDSFFKPISKFGSIETGEGYLSSPTQIENLGVGFLVVSDMQAGHLVVFDYFGNFIRFLGSEKLQEPSGLFYWNERELLLVTDIGTGKIHAFSREKWIAELVSIQKSDESKWQSPVDIVVFENRMFVLDQKISLVLSYKILLNQKEL